MVQNDRMRILQMLQDGIINADEAEKLLSALDKTETKQEGGLIPIKDNRGRKGKKFRIEVNTEDFDDSVKKANVNLSIPLSIIKTIGPIIAKGMPKEAKGELEKQGIDIIGIIESIDELIDESLNEDIVNVDANLEKGFAKVRIYVD